MRWTEPRRDSHISNETAKTMRKIIAQSLKSSPTASRAALPRFSAFDRLEPMLNSRTVLSVESHPLSWTCPDFVDG
jgi:hypothetical protein